jgi:hypothetical protein
MHLKSIILDWGVIRVNGLSGSQINVAFFSVGKILFNDRWDVNLFYQSLPTSILRLHWWVNFEASRLCAISASGDSRKARGIIGIEKVWHSLDEDLRGVCRGIVRGQCSEMEVMIGELFPPCRKKVLLNEPV